MNVTATDRPDFSQLQSGGLARSFESCSFMDSLNVSNWDMSNVDSLRGMFNGCKALQILDVSNWDVSNITDMTNAFLNTNNINLDVTNWTTTSLSTCSRILQLSTLFDRDLSGWDISNVTDFTFFMLTTNGLSTVNYDATLISWASQAPNNNLSIDFGGSQYTLGGAGETARNTLTTTYNWTIADGGGI